MNDSNKTGENPNENSKDNSWLFSYNIPSQSTLTVGFAPFRSSPQNKSIDVFYKILNGYAPSYLNESCPKILRFAQCTRIKLFF